MKTVCPFIEAEFIKSILDPNHAPEKRHSTGEQFPYVSLMGRSNVGKSSLINVLLRKKDLAKTSSLPGKTRLLNFFLIDQKLFLVDFPGYGFAKASTKERAKWARGIEGFLNKLENKYPLLFLLDSRHQPSKEDLEFIKWAHEEQRPFGIVLTKMDKLKKSEVDKRTSAILQTVGEYAPREEIPYIEFSVKHGNSRKDLIHLIQHLLEEAGL